ncbi:MULTISPECIES: hypothetical protein [Amycolatopsis]|uniref:Uncharacterized protein n=1 Tax=Amycolatopsis thermalba TaxID=944492 RepID=A0ABY4P4F9_9PSEU|nr:MULTISPECIES: hypothetical protein [Amycolatopsis]OXM73104.1 hypothetical protein CF166_11330 [Amycolatopsis sp. KNN50.9b]UQS27217.1 hypothetical protein L1857_32650 [Amycolatopsis thermalba]
MPQAKFHVHPRPVPQHGTRQDAVALPEQLGDRVIPRLLADTLAKPPCAMPDPLGCPGLGQMFQEVDQPRDPTPARA